MPIPEFEFTHPLGHRDVNHYLQNPPSEEIWRDYLNEMPFEIRTYLKETVKAYLDDYLTHKADNVTQKEVHGLRIEVGTFTPKLEGDSGTNNHTYSQSVGWYYKIGGLVWFTAVIAITTKDTNMGGAVRLGGLPFNISQFTSCAISDCSLIATGGKQLVVSLRSGVNFGRLQLLGDNTPATNLPASAIADGTSITISGCYKI